MRSFSTTSACQPAAGDETRLAVVGQYPHRGGARIHQFDKGVEEAFEQLVEIAVLAEARGDIVKDVQRLGFACQAHGLGAHAGVHVDSQRFQLVAQPVDVDRQFAKFATRGHREACREVTVVHARGPVTQMGQRFHQIMPHARNDQPDQRHAGEQQQCQGGVKLVGMLGMIHDGKRSRSNCCEDSRQ